MFTSRALAFRPDGPRAPVALSAIVGATPKHVPLKVEPTVIQAPDVNDYLSLLTPLVASFRDRDLYPNTVQYDPDAEHKEVERLITEARAIDGCEVGLTCPGWNDKEPGYTPPATASALKAALLRREAFLHRVNAADSEAKIKARGLKKAAWIEEVQLNRNFETYLQRFKARIAAFGDTSKYALYTHGDWVELQRLDLDLQALRDTYTSLTGKDPYMPWPETPPEPTSLWDMLKWAALAGVVVVGGVFIVKALPSGTAPSSQGSP